MRDALKNIFGKEVKLEDGTEFLFTIQPYEVRNMLGQELTILDEYLFTKKDSTETFKFYRTRDGNWYDLEDANPAGSATILRQLKKDLLNLEHASS